MKKHLLCLTGFLWVLLPDCYAQNTVLGEGTGSSGQQNTFLGYRTGANNAGASANTFIGHNTGVNNTYGQYNTFMGVQAGVNNTVGNSNFMLGTNAGASNTSGSGNYFMGDNTGGGNTTGGFNVYIGANAGNGPSVNGDNNLALGYEAGRGNVNGANNTAIGFRADVVGVGLSNATAIGANAIVSASNTIVLGNNANVGIGTSYPGSFRLAVEGKIGAREIEVRAPGTGWPDFVFKPNYQLRSLQEVEQFVHRQGHLPGIPSEADVKTNGIALGEMNARLLQKIEELTLYMIALEKRTQRQTRQIAALTQQVSHSRKPVR